MEDERPAGEHSREQETEDFEIVDGVIVLSGARAIEPTRSSSPQRRHVAAVAATGFVAGAATAAVLGRCLARRAARVAVVPAPASGVGQGAAVGVVVSSRRIVAVRALAVACWSACCTSRTAPCSCAPRRAPRAPC